MGLESVLGIYVAKDLDLASAHPFVRRAATSSLPYPISCCRRFVFLRYVFSFCFWFVFLGLILVHTSYPVSRAQTLRVRFVLLLKELFFILVLILFLYLMNRGMSSKLVVNIGLSVAT